MKRVKMGSKIPVARSPMFKLVTDLDEAPKPVVPKPKREKHLKTLAGNFQSRRSKSSDGFRITDKKNVRQLLEIKDDQIEKLVEKLTSLIEYNAQFSRENDRLVGERAGLEEQIGSLREQVQGLEQRDCETCDSSRESLEKLLESHKRVTSENGDLKNDVKMLKILVFRLNVQIERYQDFFRTHRQKDESVYKVDFETQEEEPPDTWGNIRSNVLAPLLNAYEETISEKLDIIQQFEREMSEFTGRLKALLEENEGLHREREGLKKSNEVWVQEKSRLQAQVDLYRNKADIQGKRADLGKEKLVEVLRVYEQKVQSQALDIERLQEAYSRCKGELTSLRHLGQKPEVVTESLKECQRLFEELKTHHDKERERLSVDVNLLTSKFEEQQSRLLAVQSENQELQGSTQRLKEENRALVEKYDGLKANINRMRQSKELLRTRLKNVINWTKGLEEGKTKIHTGWSDISQIETVLAQKEVQMQALQVRHHAELDELQRKLRNREETLKKILQNKTERK